MWVDDLARGTRVRLLTLRTALLPVWSPDGQWLAHVAGSSAKGVLTIAASDGTGASSTVACPEQRCDPTDWSPDGRWLLATVHGKQGPDVWMLPADGQGTARPLLAQPFPERDARVSPDGRLVAYVSRRPGAPKCRSGRSTRQRAARCSRWPAAINRSGDATAASWFFVDPQGLLRSTAVSTGSDGRLMIWSRPRSSTCRRLGSGHGSAQYDVSPDGQRESTSWIDDRNHPRPRSAWSSVGAGC